MESKEILGALDRAAAAPFITYPITPSWYPPLMGSLAASLAGAYFLIRAGNPLAVVVLVLMAAVAAAFFLWYRRRWGTWPDLAQAPVEIRKAYFWYFGGLAVALLVSLAVCALATPWVGVLVVFGVFTALIWWYERRVYPAACALVRSRLA